MKTIKPLAVSVEQNIYFSGINPATGTILCSQQAPFRQCIRKQKDKTLQLQWIFSQGWYFDFIRNIHNNKNKNKV